MSVLTVASWPAYRFLRRQVKWSGIPISLRIFLSCDSHRQSLQHSQCNRSRCFSGILLLLLWSKGCWQFDLWFLCFSESSLCIWKFPVPILLRPSLKDFQHNLASMWNKCSCMVIWTFFGIAFLWDWKTDLFQSCGHWCILQICWHTESALSQHHLLGFEIAQLEFHLLQ